MPLFVLKHEQNVKIEKKKHITIAKRVIEFIYIIKKKKKMGNFSSLPCRCVTPTLQHMYLRCKNKRLRKKIKIKT